MGNEPQQVRRRAACDRCHSQKLRCIKIAEQEICIRCNKARTPCMYSPFRQKPEAKSPDRRSSTASLPRSSDLRLGATTEKGESGLKKRRRDCTEQNSSELVNQNLQEPAIDIAGAAVHESCPYATDLNTSDIFGDLDFLAASVQSPLTTQSMDESSLGQFSTPNPFPSFTSNSNIEHQGVDRSNGEFQALLSPTFGKLLGYPGSADAIDTQISSYKNAPLVQPVSFPWNDPVEHVCPDSLDQCIRQLSELSLELYHHRLTVPPQSIHELNPHPKELYQSVEDYSGYKLDDTFKYSQQLVDIYPTFIKQSEGQKAIQLKLESNSTSPAPMDLASILLLLSCHTRLIDVYDELFKHIRACISQKGIAYTPQQASISRPELRVGSFVPPPSTAIPIQFMLLVQLCAQLSDHATELAIRVTSVTESRHSGTMAKETGQAKLAQTTAEVVQHRAQDLSDELSELRTKLSDMIPITG